MYISIHTHLELLQLTEDLDPVATKWFALGLQLGIEEKDLEAIHDDSDLAAVCFRKTLNAWLKSEIATHDAVIRALRSSTVGHIALASKLDTGGSQLSCSADVTSCSLIIQL